MWCCRESPSAQSIERCTFNVVRLAVDDRLSLHAFLSKPVAYVTHNATQHLESCVGELSVLCWLLDPLLFISQMMVK